MHCPLYFLPDMLAVIIETFVPLLSLFIFVLGTGFFSTLLALKMTVLQESPLIIGALTGVFYAGQMVGAFRIEPFIIRIGHIRAYSAFSSMLAVICLLHAIFYNPLFWILLRFVAGCATAGLFVVIESWLLCKSTKVNRGQVLSLYMIVYYAAQSLGQFFLYLGDPQTMLLFAITSMLCSLSILPLSMSNIQTPQYDEPSTLKLKVLINKSASGLLGCLSAGMIMGAIYGLMPTYFNHLFLNTDQVGKYMFAIIFGGMLLQYPVGKLSDVIERRLVLLWIAMATILVSAIALFLHIHNLLFFLLMIVFGGLTFTLYPISISHACDALDQRDIVAGTQSLLLAYSIGAMLGPFIAPIFMHYLGNDGIFIYFLSISGLSIPLFILRRVQKPEAAPQEEPFISMAQTTPIMAEIDPRGESTN